MERRIRAPRVVGARVHRPTHLENGSRAARPAAGDRGWLALVCGVTGKVGEMLVKEAATAAWRGGPARRSPTGAADRRSSPSRAGTVSPPWGSRAAHSRRAAPRLGLASARRRRDRDESKMQAEALLSESGSFIAAEDHGSPWRLGRPRSWRLRIEVPARAVPAP
jgi:hypothetical protein